MYLCSEITESATAFGKSLILRLDDFCSPICRSFNKHEKVKDFEPR